MLKNTVKTDAQQPAAEIYERLLDLCDSMNSLETVERTLEDLFLGFVGSNWSSDKDHRLAVTEIYWDLLAFLRVADSVIKQNNELKN